MQICIKKQKSVDDYRWIIKECYKNMTEEQLEYCKKKIEELKKN